MESESQAKVMVQTHTHQVCAALLLHAETIKGEIGVHADLTLKVRQLWCYFKIQVIKQGLKDIYIRTLAKAS